MVQQALFRVHIAVARETGLPIIIHTRDAEEDTFRILHEEMGKGAFPALIHCFTASADFGKKVLDLGLARFFGEEHSPLLRAQEKGNVVGTADFVAPEQVTDARVDIRADCDSERQT